MCDLPPQEVLTAVTDLYNLHFPLTPFASKEELLRYLSKDGTNPGPWFDELWDEYLEYDSILAHDDEGNVYRFIRTITLYVVRDRRSDVAGGYVVRETLDETVEWPDGRVTKRRFNNSLSEKIRWKEGGAWRPVLTNRRKHVRRTALEELGIWLTRRYLQWPWLRWINSHWSYMKTPSSGRDSTLDVKKDDPSRPGVITYNRLYHFFLRLSARFWAPEYREVKRDRMGNVRKTLIHRWVAASSRSSSVPHPRTST